MVLRIDLGNSTQKAAKKLYDHGDRNGKQKNQSQKKLRVGSNHS